MRILALLKRRKRGVKKLVGKKKFLILQNRKNLLQRILQIGSKENDLVLDFFAGSGTTLAVAHKTGRQYIGIEQMDYIHDLPEARLKKLLPASKAEFPKPLAGKAAEILSIWNWRSGMKK